jgi:YjbE family integral membrane protein
LATFVVVWLLNIPGLHLIGGLLLIWIAYKLMVDHKDHEVDAKNSIMSAIGTIILADAAMGIDNVLAVAGAAHGDYTLVITGLLISIPLVVWGSTMILKLLERFPVVIMIGAGVLAYTAAKMITSEGFLDAVFTNSIVKWGFVLVVVVATLWAGKHKQNSQIKETA